MSIIERLHRGVNTNAPPDETDRIMAEAADEIERLRAATIEECARLIESYHGVGRSNQAIAAAIRALKDKP